MSVEKLDKILERRPGVSVIDLSLPIQEGEGLEPFPVNIHRVTHAQGASYLSKDIIFSKHKSLPQNLSNLWHYLTGKRRLSRDNFPDGEFISEEKITLSVHTGTHLDAPYHFGSLCEGVPAKTIDRIPLEWCYGNGVVLDLTGAAPGGTIGKADILAALAKIQYTIQPFDIVLIRTDADKYWGKKEYFYMFPGMAAEATEYLVEQGVKVIGIDSMGFDRPFELMLRDYFKTRDPQYLWPSHIYGRKKEYCHIERLANLDQIPKPYGFIFACFPIKINQVGAAWTRAVAII